MQTLLIVTAGVVGGLLIVVALGWWWIKRKLKGLGEALGALAAGLGGVPPFRITLEEVAEPAWREPGRVLAATGGFEAIGYRTVGDYRIPEMEGVWLRGFWHTQDGTFAALYDHPEAGTCADVVGLFRDRTLLTVSTSPETGMDRPERSPLERMDLDLDDPASAEKLHDRLVEASEPREGIETEADQFTRVFISAYKLEQDWRIGRGGVTETEIRRVAKLSGQEPPDGYAVELVQGVWRAAIDDLLQQEILQAYLDGSPMPAAEWEEKRDRVRVVHDHSDRGDLIDELAWSMIAGSYPEDDDLAEDRLHGQAKERLRHVFSGSLCAGFAEAQSLLPEKRRFEKIATVTKPWVGDLYLEPDDLDGP